MKVPIVMLVGQAGSGKDTIADLLVKHMGGKRIALADPIKEFAKVVFRFTDRQLYGPSGARSESVAIVNPLDVLDRIPRPWCMKHFGSQDKVYLWMGNFVHGKTSVTAREVLQAVGTELGRAESKNIWVTETLTRANKLLDGNANVVVISDGRFRNEALEVKRAGGTLIRILTPDGEHTNDKHSSEMEQTTIPSFWFDKTYVNYKRSLDELERDVLYWNL